MTITEFLTARLGEDEMIALAAVGEAVFQTQTGQWETRSDPALVFAVAGGGARTQVADLSMAWERHERAAHIARHDPARVLAEVEAKRRIVAAWVSAEANAGGYPTLDAGYAEGLSEAVYLLALPYADHPDWDEAWRP